MAYDLKLADRVRAIVGDRKNVTEKAMFGGLAFLLDGKMFCGVLGDELLARVGPDAHDAAMARPHVRIMDFSGRPMRGYVFVGSGAITTAAQLGRWVNDCASHVATLPAKKLKKGSRKDADAHRRRGGATGRRSSPAPR